MAAQSSSETELELIVAFPDPQKKTERAFSFPASIPVSECLKTIVKKYNSYLSRTPGTDGDDQALNLFVAPRRLWLQPTQSLAFYELSSTTHVELKPSKGTVRAILSDGSARTFVVDRSKPVKSIIQEIADKLKLGQYGDTYGMRRPRPSRRDDAESIVGIYEPNDWLSVEDTLDAQNVFQTDEVLFCKRFVDRVPTLSETNVTDEHFTFSQARSEVMSGQHDAVLYAELQTELAAILLLLSAGRYDVKLPTNYVQDNAANILSPKWRKKPKSEMLLRIGMTHVAISGLPWAFDPRAVKQQFVLSMSKCTSYGIVSFPVEATRLSDGGGCAVGTVAISSSSFSIRPKKAGDSQEPILSLPVHLVNPISVVRNLLTFSYPHAASQGLATVASRDAAIIRDNISGFTFAASLRVSSPSPSKQPERSNSKKQLKQSSSNESLSSKSWENSLFEANASTIAEMLDLGSGLIDSIEQDISNLVMLQKQSKEGKRLSSGELQPNPSSPRTIGQLFTKAATHLSSVSRGVTALDKKLRAGSFFTDEERTKSIASIAQWCTALQLVSYCLIKSSDQTSTGVQTIAEVTSQIVSQAKKFLNLIRDFAQNTDSDKESQIKFEFSVAERTLSASCIALDLALQGRIADETAAFSLLTCCRDIRCSTSEMFSDATSVLDSVGAKSSLSVLNDVAKARAIFEWYSSMLAACSPVLFKDDSNLSIKVRSAIESIDSTASSLLSLVLERSDSAEEGSLSSSIKLLKWSWGCLNQSLKMYSSLLATAELPPSDLDPMLPPILFHLSDSIESFTHRYGALNTKAIEIVDRIAELCAAVTRSMTVFVSVQPMPMIISLSSKLESAFEHFKSLCRSNSFKDLRRMSSRRQQSHRVKVAAAALAVLDAASVMVCDTQPRLDDDEAALKSQLKLLVMNMLHLRSTLRAASVPHPDIPDTQFIQSILEQLDVMSHGIIPTIGYYTSRITSPADIHNLLGDWQQQFEDLASEIAADTKELGFFSHSIHLHKLRLLSRFADCRALTPSSDAAPHVRESKSGGAAVVPEIQIRRLQRKSANVPSLQRRTSGLMLAMRASSLSSAIKSDGGPQSPRAAFKTIQEEEPAFGALLENGAEGTLEVVNEAGLFSALRDLINLGETKSTDLSFKDALDLFLMTFPYWTVAERLTECIIAPLVATQQSGSVGTEEKHLAMRVSIALSRFLRLHPQILQEPSCRIAVNSAVSAFKAAAFLEDGARAVEDTMRECFDTLSSFERLKEELSPSNHPESLPRIDLLSIDLQALAEQLTVVEQRFFDAVTVQDLLKSAWSKNTNALSIWISHSNSLSRWVASRILQAPKKRDRVKLITRFVKLAEALKKMSNFSSAITIFLALSMDCVARLRKTWDAGAGALQMQFMKLSDSIRPLSNFSAYREELRNAQAPCIPYIAVLLRDLVTLEEVIKSVDLPSPHAPFSDTFSSPRPTRESEEDILNFQNLSTLMRVVQSQFSRFKKSRYQLLSDSRLYPELLKPDAFDLIPEDELSSVSARLEPEKARPSRSITTVPPSAAPMGSRRSQAFSISVDSASRNAVYGVRSQLISQSPPSSPTASISDRLGLSSPRTSSTSLWKRHCSSLAIHAEAAGISLSSSGKAQIGQYISWVADHLSTALKNADSPVSARKSEHTRIKSSGSDENNGTITVSSVLEVEQLLLSRLPETKFPFTHSVEPADDISNYYLSKHRYVSYLATVIQLIVAVVKVLNPENAPPSLASHTVTVVRSSETETSSMVSSYQFKFDAPGDVPESPDTAVLALLNPSASKYFANWFGLLRVKRSEKTKSLKVTVEVTSPLKTAIKFDSSAGSSS